MKATTKKIFLSFTVLAALTTGGLFGRSFISWFIPTTNPTNHIISDSIDAVIITPDIKVYSEGSSAIIVGTVKEVVDHSNKTGIPSTRIVKDAHVDISEVLKGDPSMTTVSVYLLGGFTGSDAPEDEVLLQPGEKVLLFLGKDSEGNYVVAGQSAGKCLIDKDGNVTGAPVFTMPLALLETKIREALASSVQS